MKQTRTFVVHVEDQPGVLDRVASLFRRRSYNIDSLNVGRTHEEGISRMTIVCETDASVARRIEANLYRLVNVLRVDDITDSPRVERNLALIKVSAGPDVRPQVLQILSTVGARAVDLGPDSVVVEATGTHEEIERLAAVLAPFGILEMVQTGLVAMTRAAERPQLSRGEAA
ncbi:MAG: acetolactate synthase small subunit [Myxococcales bacterium]|nr:acetolactate synthase small subunit [Myxococcales bacterium]